jgi:hypothetical protein
MRDGQPATFLLNYIPSLLFPSGRQSGFKRDDMFYGSSIRQPSNERPTGISKAAASPDLSGGETEAAAVYII